MSLIKQSIVMNANDNVCHNLVNVASNSSGSSRVNKRKQRRQQRKMNRVIEVISESQKLPTKVESDERKIAALKKFLTGLTETTKLESDKHAALSKDITKLLKQRDDLQEEVKRLDHLVIEHSNLIKENKDLEYELTKRREVLGFEYSHRSSLAYTLNQPSHINKIWKYADCTDCKDHKPECFKFCSSKQSNYINGLIAGAKSEQLKSGFQVNVMIGNFEIGSNLYKLYVSVANDDNVIVVQVNTSTNTHRTLVGILALHPLQQVSEPDMRTIIDCVELKRFGTVPYYNLDYIYKVINKPASFIVKGKTLKIVQVHVCQNDKLAEAFLLQRRNAVNDACFLGFHGTNQTSPSMIIEGGLDPRKSQSGNLLGMGAYISSSVDYCFNGNYCHETKDGFYQFFIVCFMPGRCYNVDLTFTRQCSDYRMAPPSYDTLSCVTNDTRVWALYDRYDAYPLYLVTCEAQDYFNL